MTESISELLREWRIGRGLSVRRLAQQANIGKSTLSDWESGKTVPRLRELEAVLSVMGASPQQRRIAAESVSSARGFLLTGGEADRPPVGGDLLRAMRLRQRMTQAQVSGLAGVSQGRLAKWEKGEDWPSAERLLPLCYALNAHPDETSALLMGRFEPSESLKTPFERGEALERLNSATRDAWHTAPNGIRNALRDLRFLSLISELWGVAPQEEDAYSFLTYAFASYGRFLETVGHPQEAERYIQKVLSRAQYSKPADYGDAVMARVVILSRAGKLQARSIIKTLHSHLPLMKAPQMQAWMYSEIGLAFAALDLEELCVKAHQQAFHCIERIGALPDDQENMEDYFRAKDLLKALLRLGIRARVAQFLDSPRCAALLRYPNAHAPNLFSGRLELMQALLFAGDREEARNIRAALDSHITAHNLESQCPDWETLFPNL